jgi:hypothetical protein
MASNRFGIHVVFTVQIFIFSRQCARSRAWRWVAICGLLPLPASLLVALVRVADLLTLKRRASAKRGHGDAAAVAAHLDARVALLDACNAITARLERLRRRRLLARLTVCLLPSSATHALRS